MTDRDSSQRFPTWRQTEALFLTLGIWIAGLTGSELTGAESTVFPVGVAQGNKKAALPAPFRATPATSDTPPPQTPAEALRSFHVRPGFEVELVAAEPLVVDPVAVDFGPDGRLWVAEMHDYPAGLDGDFKPGGRISVVTDTDGDGQFDRAVRLVDDVPFPTGVLAWKKGVLVCAAPDIFYLEDTDGDGRPDIRQTLYSGFATHNYQARVNTLRWGLDRWVYGAAGLFGGTIRSHLTGKDHPLSGRDFRIHPDTGEFESVGGLSQQGRVRDDFGNGFGCDNGAWMWHFPFPERYLARNPALTVPDSRVYVAQGPDANRVYPTSHTLERFNDPQSAGRTTSACGLEVFRESRLGTEFYHNAFIAEPVHNLVHRLIVEPAGTSFAGHRAADELESEFLSSSDNWFRPVETRTGPDGALWVVDMYRFVIEHPRWISPERLAKLDPRAGDQQGRLYRVKRTGDTQRSTWSDLTRQTTAQLVTVLGQDNGVLRDLAHRQLLERADIAAVPGVQALVQGNARPGPRVQALYLLAQLGGLSKTLLLQVLRDREPAMRQAALDLSETSVTRVEAVRQRWQEMVEDPDPRVRLQLAFSLGELPGKEAGPALGRLALTEASDARMRTAILSSSAQCVPEVLQVVLQSGTEVPGRQALVNELIATSGKTGDAASRAAVLALIVPMLNETVNDGHLTTVGLLIQAGGLRENAALQLRLERVWAEARRRALDPQESLPNRRSALHLLGLGPLSEADLNLLGATLARPESFELAQAALGGLKQSASPRIGGLLLQDWATKPPALRATILEELLNREAWTDPLLAALEAGTVAPRELSATQRQKLARHPNPQFARRASTALPNAPDSDRAAVIRAYADAGELPGISQRGLAHFQELCAACHAFRGAGQAVGPDLATFREKPLNEFLVAILDPNSVIEPRFLPYEIETRDQRLLTGVIQNETANSLTLVQSGAVRETLLRSDLVSLKPGVYSLMPEGLETALDPQGMADLVAYLRSPSPRGFGSATAESAALARQEFRESAAPGVARIVFASESLEYRSWLGTSPFRLARQTDGTGRVEWESPPPGDSGAPDSWVQYDVPIGLGFFSQPAGGFTLLLNGRKVFDFEVVRGDARWVSEDPPVRAGYQVRERSEEDGNGLLTLAVQRSALPPGEPVRWTVRAGQANSQRWFGIYELGATEARTETTLPGPAATLTVVAATLLNDQVSPADREKLIRDRGQSAADLITAMAQGLGPDSKEEYRRIPWLWRVAFPAGRSDDAAVLRQLLDAALPAPGDALYHWQAVVLGGGVINGLSQVRTNPGERLSQLLKESAPLRARWDRSLALAVTMATEAQVPAGTRYDALRMIALLPWATARPLLEVHLASEAHPELQQGAVSGLLDSPEAAAAQLILEHWPKFTPANQKLALTGLLRTDPGRHLLDAAVRNQRIPASALDPETRERLRSKGAGTD